MDLSQQILSHLYELRTERLHLVSDNLNLDDPEIMNKLVADAINALENLFLFMNLPQEGFFPNTSKEE